MVASEVENSVEKVSVTVLDERSEDVTSGGNELKGVVSVDVSVGSVSEEVELDSVKTVVHSVVEISVEDVSVNAEGSDDE